MPAVDVGLTITAINNATGAIRDVSGQVKTLGENAQATSNRLKAIQVVIAGILLSKTLEYGKALIAASIAQQNINMLMTRFAGGAQQAIKVQSDLNARFAATPYHIDAINQAWARVRATMQSNEGATKVITAIVNDVAAMGGQEENINNLAQSFQRLFARGYASSREYVAILTQTGLTLGDLAKAAGTTSTNMERQLRAGFMNSAQFVDVFVKASQQRFGDFSKSLKSTAGGAFMSIKNAFDEGLQGVGERTDLNARMAALFNNMAEGVKNFFDHIDQSKIDALFNWFAQIEPLVEKVAVSLYNIGTVLLTLGGDVAQMLGMMPQEALEWGMIGYFLLGKKGALLAALLGSVVSKTQEIVPLMNAHPKETTWANTYNMEFQGSAAAGKKFMGTFLGTLLAYPDAALKTVLAKSVQGIYNAAPTTQQIMGVQNNFAKGAGGGSVLPNQKQIDDTKKSMQGFLDMISKMGNAAAGGAPASLVDYMEHVRNLVIEANDVLDQTRNKIDLLNFQNTGNQLGATIANIQQQGAAALKTIDTEIAKLNELKIQTDDTKKLVADLTAQRQRELTVMEAAVTKAKEMYAIEQQQFVLQQKITQMQNVFALQQLKTANMNGVGANLLQGTSGGQAMQAFYQQRQQYNEQVVQYDNQILSLEAQIKDVQADPAKVAALQVSITSIEQLRDGTKEALQGLTVEATLQRDLWQQVGGAIENDLSSGIIGLIQGTKSLGDVARSVFADMIQMAIKYYVQLLMIKAIQMFSTFGDGGTIPGGVAFANGGVTPNVKPFANGDIVGGPTLFGLAGEAGTEAIMPLTRIGGKLGVRAEGTGGGGDHYHIHMNAIDAQSGLEFVYKNIGDIDVALQQRKRLNRGGK